MEDLNLSNEELNTPEHNQNINFAWQQTFQKMIGSMKFVAYYNLITGGLACLTIIGAVIGVPTIFLGLRLKEAAEEFEIFKRTNNSAALKRGFEAQGKHFFIQKVLIIIGLAFLVLYIIFVVIIIGFSFSQLNEFNQMSLL